MKAATCLALALAIAAGGVAAEDPPKFPSRNRSGVGTALFEEALAKSQNELRNTLEQMQELDRRYRGGEGIGFDPAQVMQMGLQALTLIQQIQQLEASRGGGAALAGGRTSPENCAMFKRYANQCRRDQAAMGSRGTGRGTTGQAGAFNDCAAVYEKAYREAC